MEKRLLFEHLMCKAFNTNRFECSFANANHYDHATLHLEQTHAYVVSALFLIKEELKNKGLEDLRDKVYKANPFTLDVIDDVLQQLSDAEVIY